MLDKPAQPVVTDELSVGSQIADFLIGKRLEESLEQSDALAGFRVASLAKVAPEQRDRNAPTGDGENEMIDFSLPEFPVGSVETEYPFLFEWHHCHKQSCDVSEVKSIAAEKPLDALVGGLSISFPPESRTEPVE